MGIVYDFPAVHWILFEEKKNNHSIDIWSINTHGGMQGCS